MVTSQGKTLQRTGYKIQMYIPWMENRILLQRVEKIILAMHFARVSRTLVCMCSAGVRHDVMRGNELLRSLCHTVPSSARGRVPQSILTSMLHLHCIYSGQFSSYRNWKLFLLYQNGVEFLNPFGYNKGGKLEKAVIVGAI